MQQVWEARIRVAGGLDDDGHVLHGAQAADLQQRRTGIHLQLVHRLAGGRDKLLAEYAAAHAHAFLREIIR